LAGLNHKFIISCTQEHGLHGKVVRQSTQAASKAWSKYPFMYSLTGHKMISFSSSSDWLAQICGTLMTVFSSILHQAVHQPMALLQLSSNLTKCSS